MKCEPSGDIPFSKASLATLKNLMFIKKTDRGILYGKTGSGADDDDASVLGWFAGYAEGNGKTYAFACVTQGKNVMSKNARAILESGFGNIRACKGMDHFTLRSRLKVNIQWTLYCLVHNIGKLANFGTTCAVPA